MENNFKEVLKSLGNGITLNPLPPLPSRDPNVPHAPVRVIRFSQKDEMVIVSF